MSGPLRVLFVQYTNPAGYPPLEHGSQLLAREGWEVLFLGTRSLGESDRLKMQPHPLIRLKSLPYCPPGFLQKLHYAAFSLWVCATAVVWRPRWVYLSDPLGCPVGLLLKKVFRRRLIYHEHDLPAGFGHRRAARVIAWARRRLAQEADALVAPNSARADRLVAETESSQPVFCVMNCPLREEAVESRSSPEQKPFVLIYHGSLVPRRFPASILEALAVLPETVRLRIVGYETDLGLRYRAQLEQKARELNVAGRVEFLGVLPTRKQMMGVISCCRVGLSLVANSDDLNERTLAGASNKAFEQLACGLPLLVTDSPEWKRMFVDPGYALACDPSSPASIAGAVQWMLQNPGQTREMGEKGRSRIRQEWNYERQFAPVLNWMGS